MKPYFPLSKPIQNNEGPQHRSLDLLCGHLEVFAAREPSLVMEALRCSDQFQDTGLPGDEVVAILATALLEVANKELTCRAAALRTLPAVFQQ